MIKPLIAIAALVASICASAETPSGLTYLAIDLRSMDYFWLNVSEGKGITHKSVGVTFNYKSAYMARRLVGDEKFFGMGGYVTPTTLKIYREGGFLEGELFMLGTPSKGGWEGYFYDENGNQDGRFIATTDFDYSNKALWYICGREENYRCTGMLRGARGHQECQGRGFPGKFSHLTIESCEDELKSWQVDEKAREEAWKCAPENKEATFSSRLNDGCLEPSNSFKTAQKDPLMYNQCLVSWVEASRIEIFPLVHSKRTVYLSTPSSFFMAGRYQFASTVEETTFDLYFNDDVPEVLKYLVNEAAYSCVVDPSSAPPEEFWPMPWAKPSWEAEED